MGLSMELQKTQQLTSTNQIFFLFSKTVTKKETTAKFTYVSIVPLAFLDWIFVMLNSIIHCKILVVNFIFSIRALGEIIWVFVACFYFED